MWYHNRGRSSTDRVSFELTDEDIESARAARPVEHHNGYVPGFGYQRSSHPTTSLSSIAISTLYTPSGPPLSHQHSLPEIAVEDDETRLWQVRR